MHQDTRLPPDPKGDLSMELRHDSTSLPPFDSDMLEMEKKLGRKFGRGLFRTQWTTPQLIAIIFIASFLMGVIFTSAILAGIIEIHPSAIKSFFKSLMGQG